MPVEHIGKAPGLPLRGREPGGSETIPRESLFSVPTPLPTGEDGGPKDTLLRAETGRLPSLLDTREQPAQTEKRAKQRIDQRARRKQETVKAITRALEIGKLAGVELDAQIGHAFAVLEGWRVRLAGCGQQAVHLVCPDDNHHIVKVQCCKVPACPHQEARTAKRWTMRGDQIMKRLRNGEKWAVVRARLLKEGVNLPKEEPDINARMSWKLLTISTKKDESLVDDIENQIHLRKLLVRFLRRRYGLVAAFAAVEVGSGGNAHLHALIYAPYLPREDLQHWLQSQDCDVPDCKHKPGDHDCGGSWAVDIRAAFDPREALKYACSPDAKNLDRDNFAELRLLTYLILYKRHRIETYGLAKPGAWKAADLVDVVLEQNYCPYCGQEMVIVEMATLSGETYHWSGGTHAHHGTGIPPPPPSNRRSRRTSTRSSNSQNTSKRQGMQGS